MNYHIVTGSKGGVGKTLLSLMLLAYFWRKNKQSNEVAAVEKKPRNYILAIDLNAMNVDFWRVLKKYNDNYQEMPSISLGKRNFRVVRFSYESNDYLFMFPENPYITYGTQSFSDLLVDIKRLSSGDKKYNPLLGSSGIETVVIDTNYHFCSLFAEVGGSSYDCFRKGGLLETDNIFIWFMWVYAQFAILSNGVDDAKIILNTARQIEEELSRGRCSPFLHVISPASLVVEGSDFAKRISNLWKHRKSATEDSYKVLNIITGNYQRCITFDEWLKTMNNKFKEVPLGKDEHERFADALTFAIKELNPINIIRLMSYERKLRYYADRQEPFTINDFMAFELYNQLSDSLRGNNL